MKRLCHFRTEPNEYRECLEACWSKGQSCEKCFVSCYRVGWNVFDVVADNKKLVKERHIAINGSY